MKGDFLNFEDFNAWRYGRVLVLEIYKITKNFPRDELFSLTNQMRRSSVSVISNTAEGFGRISYKDKIYFYRIALGSLIELQSQVFISKDLDYITQEKMEEIKSQILIVHKMLNKAIGSLRKLINSNS